MTSRCMASEVTSQYSYSPEVSSTSMNSDEVIEGSTGRGSSRSGWDDPGPSNGMSAEPIVASEPATEPTGTEPATLINASSPSGPSEDGSIAPVCAPAVGTDPRVTVRARAPVRAVNFLRRDDMELQNLTRKRCGQRRSAL